MAKTIASIASFIGWIVVVIGVFSVFFALVSASNSRYGSISLLTILPSLGSILAGLFLIMSAQVTKAAVDTADYSREMLTLLQKE